MASTTDLLFDLTGYRSLLPIKARPADDARGTWWLCTRCKGKGDARYNRKNGDEYCYLCQGSGWQLRPHKLRPDAREPNPQLSTHSPRES